jgi:Flp pilus assembly protein TadG
LPNCARARTRPTNTTGGDEGRRSASRSGGQATVEFALVILLLVVLLIAIIDFGRMVAMHVAAVAASREGARYGAAVGIAPSTTPPTPRYLHCAGIRNQARATTSALITLTNADIDIAHDDGPGTGLRIACEPPDAPVPPPPTSITTLDRVVVTVTFTYQPITPLLQSFFGPITVVSTDRRTIVLQPQP